MSVPASPKHVPAIPDQLPVELPLAPNPPEVNNDYLDAIDYDDKEETYKDLDDEEEDPEEDLEMDLDEEEEDPKIDLDKKEEAPEIDVDDEEEDEPLPVSPPPLSPVQTPPPTEIAKAHKEAIRARQRLNKFIWKMSSVTMDRDRIEKTQDQGGKQIQELRHRLTLAEIMLEVAIIDRVDATITAEQTATAAKAAKVARAAATAETTRAAATADGAEGSNNVGRAAGVGGPNVVGPAVGVVAMNALQKVRGCSYKEFMNCEPINFKGTEGDMGLTRWFERSKLVFLISKCAENDKVKYVTSTLLDEALSWWNFVAQPINIENACKIPWVELKKMMIK
uniref:Reverse transcriptase domain-containing protein n=1 Tax=Tanacetum cinerariifolium TaxID=118510 RepID=A0A699I639_TANCI|nr:reverse transcriptase domain-containing protein [Tanacetum cinerariifolium]